MREIKFCAWHTELKKMFTAEEMGEDQLTLSVDGKGFVNVSSLSTKLSHFAGDRIVPLQFTGLKDKNGKEIYEGYIVKLYDPYTKSQLETNIIWDSENCRFAMKNTFIDFDFLINDELEIIGNIYENPELLKS
jgi:uncharacterized phage protein (TIGR01671 family)